MHLFLSLLVVGLSEAAGVLGRVGAAATVGVGEIVEAAGVAEAEGAELALAMHEADHRYTVSGYVRDDAGKPQPDIAVLVEHKVEGGQKKKVTTNWLGYYEVVFHLHNTNVDDQIAVTVGSEVKTYQIQFDPNDAVTERRGGVDFGAPASHSGAVGWYAGGGVLLVLAALYFYKIKRKGAKRAIKQQRGRHGK